MYSEIMRSTGTKSAELRSSIAQWLGLPLVALVAALWLAPSIAGTASVVSESSSARNGLLEKGVAVLAAESFAQATGHTAEQHDHRDPSDHGGYGCEGIDCSGVANLALRDSRPFPLGPQPAVRSNSPVAHLTQPPLRPPRSAV
jgi:hypothetical protein